MSRKDSAQFIEECYSLYEQKMYRVAFAILKDPDAAEDAVQDAFLKLMKSGRVFEDAGSDDCKRFMIAVIRSAAISIYRIRKRDSGVILFPVPEGTADSSAEQDSGDAPDLKDLLEALPAKYRDVVQCLAADNLSVRETSERLQISESCVRKRFEAVSTRDFPVKKRPRARPRLAASNEGQSWILRLPIKNAISGSISS